VLTGSTKSPKDPHAVAKNCYLAFVFFPPSCPSFPLEEADLLFPTQRGRLRSFHSLLRLSSTSPCSLFRSAVRLISSFLSSPTPRSA
jgi:hypothetical protein